MNGHAAKVLLSLALFPLLTAVNILFSVVLDPYEGFSPDLEAVLAAVGNLLFVYVYWAWVWRATFCRTRRRRTNTFVVWAVSLLAGALLGLLASAMTHGDGWEILLGVGCASAGIIWLIGTLRAWRETPDERIERLRDAGAKAFGEILLCGKCGYTMTGLSEARCPECGTKYTLDGLLAVNAERLALKRDPTATFDA